MLHQICSVLAGVTGPLARVDARRPPCVVAEMLQSLLTFRDSLLNNFSTNSMEPRPLDLSEEVIQARPLCTYVACLVHG